MSLLSREEWLAKIAKRIGGGLSRDDSELAAVGGLTAVLIASSVAAMHSGGRLLDEIAARAAIGQWMQNGADPSDAVTGAISTFRAGQFPSPKWWDAVLVEVSLLECWADQALRSGPRERIEDLLRTRWLVGGALVEPEAADCRRGRGPARHGLKAARPWLKGDQGDVEALLAAAAPVAAELDTALGEAGVDIQG
jgi:hypothetical protein